MKRIAIFMVYVGVLCLFTASAHAGLNDGLVAYYPFNGNANDESGNGNNGTVYGATPTTDRFGVANSAFSFDGVNDYIDIPYRSSLEPSTFTISIFVKVINSTSSTMAIINSDPDGGLCNHGWRLYTRTTNTSFEVDPSTSCSDDNEAVAEGTVRDDSWHNIVVVYNGAPAIYIDGLLRDIGNNSSYSRTHASIRIGMRRHSTASQMYYSGSIDDIRIYNRALSLSEIKLLSLVNPPSNDFGIKAIGWSSQQRFYVTNSSSETLSIGTLSLAGSDSSEFMINNDNCSDATLAPLETRSFDVAFSPVSLGSKSASAVIPLTSPTADTLEVFLQGLVTEICNCDLNEDGRCDMMDWLLFGQRWGATDCASVPCACDLNADGRCDMRDWLIFGQDWGRTDCPVQ